MILCLKRLFSIKLQRDLLVKFEIIKKSHLQLIPLRSYASQNTTNALNEAINNTNENPLSWIPDSPDYIPWALEKNYFQNLADKISDSMIGLFNGNIPLLILSITFICKIATFPLQYHVIKQSEQTKILMPKYNQLMNKYRIAALNGFNERVIIAIQDINRFYKETNFSPKKQTIFLVLQIPFHMSSFALSRYLSIKDDFDFTRTGVIRTQFFWCDSISDIDPTNILPMICAALQCFNVQFSQPALEEDQKIQRFQKQNVLVIFFKKYSFLAPLCFIPIYKSMPAGSLLYLVTTSSLNMAISIISRYVIMKNKNNKSISEILGNSLKNNFREIIFSPRRILQIIKANRRLPKRSEILNFDKKIEMDEYKFKQSGIGQS